MTSYLQTLKRDIRLRKILNGVASVHLPSPTNNYCLALCKAIIGQQLSIKVAASIFDRFTSLLTNEQPTQQQILLLSTDRLRKIGLSKQKANYIHHIAQFFVDNKVTPQNISLLSNEEVVALLTKIKGVGEWTVQMFLLFTLGRENIFAPKDLGIQRAMLKLYPALQSFRNKRQLEQEMEVIAQKWSPYKSYACLHLWNWKEQQKAVT